MRNGYLDGGNYQRYGYDPLMFGHAASSYGYSVAPYGYGPSLVSPDYEQRFFGPSSAAAEMAADTAAGFRRLRIAPVPASSPVASTELMPIPLDPNDPVMRAATGRSGLGTGYALFGSQAVVRFTANVKLDLTYDTGAFTGASANPSTIALDGTNAAHGRGTFDMAVSNATIKSDVQLPSGTLWTQGFYDLNFTEEGVEARQLYGRVEDALGGLYWSTFSNQAVLPETIVTDAVPAGAIGRRKQLQLHYTWKFDSGWSMASAIERPTIDDFTMPTGATALRRYPDLVGRVRYQPDHWQAAQVATLVRQMGFEDASGFEEFATGWGVSGTLNMYTWGADNVRVGCSGGEGLGSYLFGLAGAKSAAFPSGTELEPLENFGCFAGYEHYWTRSLWSNFAYGFCESETIPGVADSAKQSQNAWTNLLYDIVPGKIAVAVEYQYGLREVANGIEGDNHHIQFAFQVGVGYKADEEAAATAEAAASGMRQGFVPSYEAAPQAPPLAPAPSPQRFRRL